MNFISKDITTKEEAINLANENKDEFYKIAKKVIEDNGYNYDVNIEIGNFSLYFRSNNSAVFLRFPSDPNRDP